jgi:tetratricopeptide (TPR) repeat protein
MNNVIENRLRTSRVHIRLITWTNPLAFVALTIVMNPAFATCPSEKTSWTLPPQSLVVPAQLLYNAGNAFLNQTPKDYESALEMFMNSRAVYPSPDNSLKAAECLRALGRFPEALVLYKEILLRFDKKLTAKEREEFQGYIAQLKENVITVYVAENEGTFAIDDEQCGALPRAAPVYLMPGTHEWRVKLGVKKESVQTFSGKAGSVVRLQLPRLPIKTTPKETGKWFVSASVGLPIGLLSTSADSQIIRENMIGIAAQGMGGYRFASGMSLGLASGVLNAERQDEAISHLVAYGKIKTFAANYEITPRLELRAPFIGVLLGFEPHINDRLDFWVRGGVGILGVQAKQVLDVVVTGPTSETTNVFVEPQGYIRRDVPAFAVAEMGLSLRVGPMRFGLGLKSFVTFHRGKNFVGGRIQPRGPVDGDGNPLDECDSENEEGRNIRCVPGITFSASPSYRPTFFVIPQIVVGVVF